MKPKYIAILVLVVLLVIILAQNTHAITINLFFWSISMSQVLLIFFSALAGFIIGYLTCLLTNKKMKAKKGA